MPSDPDFPRPADGDAGSRLATENARRLLDASIRLGEDGSFGTGASLAVLAGEEAIKALALMAWSSDLPIPTRKQLSLVLRNHDSRHLAAGMLAGAGEMVIALIAGVFAAFTKKVGSDASPEEQQKERWSRAAWWSEADNLKQRGLYVEFERHKWKTPADVTRAEFERAVEMAGDFVTWLEDIMREEDPSARQGIVLGAPTRLGYRRPDEPKRPR